MEQGSNEDPQGDIKPRMGTEDGSGVGICAPGEPESVSASTNESVLIDWSKLDSLLASLKLSSLQFGKSPWVLICRTDFDYVLNAGNPELEEPFAAQTIILNLKTLSVLQKVFSITLSRLVA